jgi:hypothetical protein
MGERLKQLTLRKHFQVLFSFGRQLVVILVFRFTNVHESKTIGLEISRGTIHHFLELLVNFPFRLMAPIYIRKSASFLDSVVSPSRLLNSRNEFITWTMVVMEKSKPYSLSLYVLLLI